MRLTNDEHRYLLQRKQELQREIRDIERWPHGPCYYEMDERRIDLLDELNRVEAELQMVRPE